MDFYPTLEYKASIENTLIIVTKPLYSYIDGIKYCGYEHNCLYFDQFTEKPPIRLSLGNLPVSELLYCGYKYIPISCINAIHFYNKLTELERNNLIFVNVDIDWLKFRDEFEFHIFERIDRNNYTCIIKPCSISKEEVDNWNLKNDILVINENAVISSVSQEQWIRKAIISIEYHYSFDYSNQGYYTAIIDLILDYNLSGKAVADCIFSIATKESIDKRNIRAKLNALYSFRRIE
ncbi:MAG: hypothetical protein II981_00900 [Bacteroidales bacterium]|nr:hypothetical protein [Bacteroidales bacterium]